MTALAAGQARLEHGASRSGRRPGGHVLAIENGASAGARES
jgi:hypothetical protein